MPPYRGPGGSATNFAPANAVGYSPISRKITNRITAPMKASMMAAIKPVPRWMPSCGNSHPAITAPIMPTTMLPMQPVAAAFDHHAGKPAGDGSDDQPNDDAFDAH